jgi:hypothetical protein
MRSSKNHPNPAQPCANSSKSCINRARSPSIPARPNRRTRAKVGKRDRSWPARSAAGRPPSDSSLSTRATHAQFRQRSLHRSSGRGRRHRTAPRRCSVQGSRSRSAQRSEPRPAQRRLEPERARREARATQDAVGSPAFARKGATSTFMPVTARGSAKAPTGALALASATAPKTPREARRITSNADIGTSGCVPGARREKPPPVVYELGTASGDSNRRAVIPGWRGNFLSRSES